MAPSFTASQAVDDLPHGKTLPTTEELISHIPERHRAFLDDPEALAAWHEPYVPGSDEEKALVRKISFRLMPIIWLCYVLNYLDRTNIGLAKEGGMAKDLNLDSNRYSVALLIFFCGYLLFEIPSNMLLTRCRPSLFLSGIMVCWGSLTIAFKGINNYGELVALRFLLGVVESGFFPGCLLLFSSLYKKNELSKIFGVFYSASIISGAFGGLIAAAIIDGMDGVGGVRGWRWLFVLEGLATVVVAAIAAFLLPNYPATTKWLTPREKALAVKRLLIQAAADHTGEEIGHKQGFMMAVKDYKTWLLTVGYMAVSSAGTISYFIPTIVTQLGYTGTEGRLFTAPPYAVALVFSLTVNFSADYFKEKAFHSAIPIGLSGIFCVVQATYPSNTASYVLLCFVAAGIWSTCPCFLSYATTVVSEPLAKRAVAIAIINSLGNFASVYGSFLWPSDTAPQYVQGWSVTAAMCFLATVTTLVVRWRMGPMRDEDDEAAKVARLSQPVRTQSVGESDSVDASYTDDKKGSAGSAKDEQTRYHTTDADL